MVTAYRLLDVIYSLEHPVNGIKAPEHERLPVNFASFRVTFFLITQSNRIHLQSYLDHQAARRLDIGRQNVSKNHQSANDYERSTYNF